MEKIFTKLSDNNFLDTRNEQMYVLFGLVDRGDVISEPPEEQGDDDGAPHVGQSVEERVRPVAEDRYQRLARASVVGIK